MGQREYVKKFKKYKQKNKSVIKVTVSLSVCILFKMFTTTDEPLFLVVECRVQEQQLSQERSSALM